MRRWQLVLIATLIPVVLLLRAGAGGPTGCPVPRAPAAAHAAARGPEDASYRVVVVEPGDTLWDIARRTGPPGADPRRQVDVLRQLNGLSNPLIYPGQPLRVPVCTNSHSPQNLSDTDGP